MGEVRSLFHRDHGDEFPAEQNAGADLPNFEEPTSALGAGEAWRRSRIVLETGILELERMIADATQLTEIWKESLRYSLHTVRMEIVSSLAYTEIIRMALDYVRTCRHGGVSETTPSEFIHNAVIAEVLRKREAEILASGEGPYTMNEFGRPPRDEIAATRVSHRRALFRLVR